MDPIAATACPIQLGLSAIRGDSISATLRILDRATWAAANLTGYTGAAKIYAGPREDVALHELTVVVDPAGLVTVSAAPGASQLWAQSGWWTLVLESVSTRKTIIAGPWTLHGVGSVVAANPCGLCPAAVAPAALGTTCATDAAGVTEIWLPFPAPACGC